MGATGGSSASVLQSTGESAVAALPQVVEIKDGSGDTTDQFVWGPAWVAWPRGLDGEPFGSELRAELRSRTKAWPCFAGDAMEDSAVALPRDHIHNPNNVLEQRLYAAHDTLYSVLQLVDEDGNVVEQYSYSPYGADPTDPRKGAARITDGELVEQTLGPMRDALGLTDRDFLALGRVEPDDESESFCMTVLALKMSQYRNGVSARHGRVSRCMWRSVWSTLPKDMVPIGHITNGVHVASWLAVSLAPLYERYLGPDWQKRVANPRTWDAIEEIDDAELWDQYQVLKARLVAYVQRCLRRQSRQRGAPESAPLDPAAMTIGFARRFAPYKRADLLFTDPEGLARLVGNDEHPVQIIYAGKAHPGNEEGKRLLQKILHRMQEKAFAGRAVFIEDHDMNVSRHLVQGADVWLNTPRRPLEACGTSGQKVVLNGGLNLSVLDGWWAQAYDGQNGFAIGCGEECTDERKQDQRDAASLYDVLEDQVIPLFYERDEKGVPHGWIARQKRAVRTLAWRFSGQRMIRDYTMRCYLPAVGGATCSMD